MAGDRPRAVHCLPADARERIDTRVEQLLDNPWQQPRFGYDERTDQWTTTYGNGAGLIVYAVVYDRQRGSFCGWCSRTGVGTVVPSAKGVLAVPQSEEKWFLNTVENRHKPVI